MTETEDWEIVQGDFGEAYRAVAKDLDLSTCIAKIRVWRGLVTLIDEKPDAGMEVIYDSDEEESYCTYFVQDGDFPLTAIVNDDITQYNVMVKFTKDGYQQHDLGFKWIVTPAPPSVE